MQIDGDEVYLNDRVWHDRYGWGKVTAIGAGTCDVLFDNGENILTFTEGGYQHRNKVLFWSNPMLFSPKKDVDYTKFIAVVQSLLDLLHGEK